MKKLSIFLATFLFSATITFENNLSLIEKNETNISINFESNKTNLVENNKSNENNSSKDINISENNLSDNNFSDINISEINFSTSNLNPTPKTEIKEINCTFATLNPHIDIAVVFEKHIFDKYKKEIINSITSYLLYKKVNFNIQVFKDINTASSYYENILYFTTDTNFTKLKDYPNNFFFPVIFNDKNVSDNLFFSGLNFKQQINKLITFMESNRSIIINSNTILAKKLTKIETKEINASIQLYPHIKYKELNNSYIFFNTPSNKTAEILSNISYKNITPKLEFSSQINYDPLLIKITQPEDTKNLLIANSLLNIPLIIDSYNNLLNTDIRFNWLNYTTSLLLNKIYNLNTNSNEFFLNDFKMYIFNNQVDYKTKIYQIINNSFRQIY